ncbi:hypothetical protein QBC33DRAFT_553411 [Phialemonium atrogriseum]|uniref:PD-(D/E)XK nuclease-like domain-containing protein n=1 Tax=Phialemonium atrogriseum TaxID=1093897 RepID=A0AAJ0FAS9_9PEZI|nr:uncharacterized protein QBC33DRAFT_553411 [Phialemonium atrogriseum]KAK1761711.1 hypothetical protein QBC33DRAFT_553411 [Phialemonium atrogriseum]
MKPHTDILDWLSHVDFQPDSPSPSHANRVPKRHRDCSQPLSPPSSERIETSAPKPHYMSESDIPTSKRRRLGLEGNNYDEEDQQQTPRASENSRSLQDETRWSTSPTKRHQGLQRNHSTQAVSIISVSSQSDSQSQASSRTSGRSSPTKRMAAMELNLDGLESRTLSLTNPDLPNALADLLSEMEVCSTGAGVVSRSRKDEIDAQASTDRSFAVFRDFMFGIPEARDRFGTTPTVPDVQWILEEARECQDTIQSESGWNMAVHFPLLQKAIYGCQRRKQLVGTAPCTTAKIINQYLPSASPTKMVDFSLFLAPDSAPISAANTAALQAIQSLRRVLPCNVINHTDFPPLRNRPIALSIETKRRGGGEQQEADLQIGIWHAAQWKFLSRLVSDAGGDLDTLPFLPAIIVRGHEWSFAATTREGQKTVLWLERNFGSTTNALGVYSIVWGLQRLAAWAEHVYWPWFKQNALGM